MALLVEDITTSPDGSGVVLIRCGKTDQEGRGAEVWLSPRTMDQLGTWLSAAGITAGPIFRSVNKGGRVGARALPAGEVSRILKALAARAGLDPAAICDSAWKKDPVEGVIGVQKGPL